MDLGKCTHLYRRRNTGNNETSTFDRKLSSSDVRRSITMKEDGSKQDRQGVDIKNVQSFLFVLFSPALRVSFLDFITTDWSKKNTG